MNYKEDFPVLNEGIVYFDNGATTLKPKSVIEKINDYYYNYPANTHRGDYKISLKSSDEFEKTRTCVKEFINAKSNKEIIFTSGCTESLSMIIYGYFYNKLNKDDEVLITKSEHASNIVPWFDLENKLGVKVKFIPLNDDYSFNIDNMIKEITDKTKVVSLAEITNVIGDKRDIKKITEICHERGIKVICDAAQSAGHIKIDVQDTDVDFLALSAHKMLGPTGVGILYGKEELLNEIDYGKKGGGTTISFDSKDEIVYKELPYKLEAGTQNIAGVIGFKEAINYINKIGLDNIEKYLLDLKKYLVSKLSKLDNIIIYNKDILGFTVAFNVKGVFAQDTVIYLDKYNICVRGGDHCDKKLKDEIGINNTVRISLYFYNTKEECDKLVDALSRNNILEESLGV
ncbi:MAG: cysteine desulfurase [Bacilli bacterium]|nr:cysteine desulfurase [Bacilli bacterium]